MSLIKNIFRKTYIENIELEGTILKQMDTRPEMSSYPPRYCSVIEIIYNNNKTRKEFYDNDLFNMYNVGEKVKVLRVNKYYCDNDQFKSYSYKIVL